MSRQRAPLLRPRQIADLLTYLSGVPFSGEVIRCWPRRRQWQCECWAHFTVRNEILAEFDHWPVGRTPILPSVAVNYMETKSAYQRMKGWRQKTREAYRKQQWERILAREWRDGRGDR